MIVHDHKKRQSKLAKGHLLVVDNDEEFLEIFLQIVKAKEQELPFTVSYLSDASQVMEYLTGKGIFADRMTYPECDLMLLDIHMPEVDGFRVLKMMQETKSGYRRPLVAMHSSSMNPSEEHTSLAPGCKMLPV